MLCLWEVKARMALKAVQALVGMQIGMPSNTAAAAD